jgi:5'-deoxynucleotidase YfbR-like HD superfamily hydrolase
VAEHSVIVSHHVPPEDALWGLLHDGAEAYSADVSRPIKRCIPEWAVMEAGIVKAICEHFGLPRQEPVSVKQADFSVLVDERNAIMSHCEREWGSLPEPLGVRIVGLSPSSAEKVFLDRFKELTRAPT